MVVRYFNSYEDLLALQKFVLRNSAVGKKAMLHRFLAVEIVVLFVCLMFAVNHNRFYVLLAFLIISGLAWWFRERSVMMQFKKDFKRGLRKDELETSSFIRWPLIRNSVSVGSAARRPRVDSP